MAQTRAIASTGRQLRLTGSPKAFAITRNGGWYFNSANPNAMRLALEQCQKSNVKCWLYAVDEQVVWEADVAKRIDLSKLQPTR